ncbi:MAG: LysR family transcriptional regulator substrate-binding protein [Roseibium sp.]|nr:LysR family transcriptional regulator substrate-binding protein [Roseibium sp.]
MVLKIAMIEDFDTVVLPAWLTAVTDRFPNLRFHVKSGPSHENHATLGNRAADLILASEALETPDWVEDHPILADPYILVRSAEIAPPRRPDDLMRHPFVRYSRELMIGRHIEAHLRRSKAVPRRAHEFSTHQAVFSMVEAMGAWAITPASAFLNFGPTASVAELRRPILASALPFPGFSRHISLQARSGALAQMPSELAGLLRLVIQRHLVGRLGAELADSAPNTCFRILGPVHLN